MSIVTFFHHERGDDATRTGLTVDGRRGLEQFTPGGEEYDPAIRWFVDVNVPEVSPPSTRAELAVWLTCHHETIKSALVSAEERLAAGFDSMEGPWTFDMATPGGPVRVAISAQRRYDGAQIGNHLRVLLERIWPAFVREFTPALVSA